MHYSLTKNSGPGPIIPCSLIEIARGIIDFHEGRSILYDSDVGARAYGDVSLLR